MFEDSHSGLSPSWPTTLSLQLTEMYSRVALFLRDGLASDPHLL